METTLTIPTPSANGHTGPKTIAGKTRSRLNALKHGITACDEIFLTSLEPARRKVYYNLRQCLRRHYRPVTEYERLLVDRIAIQQFRVLSLYRLEQQAMSQTGPFLRATTSIVPHLDRFSRYDVRIERQIRILHNRLVQLYKNRGVNSLKPFPTQE